MFVLIVAFGIGVVAGLRAFTAPAAVSWVARLGWLPLAGTGLAFLGSPWALGILMVAALGELVNDQLPRTPSRKTPPQFIARIFSGALCGAAIGIAAGSTLLGLCAGAAGAVAGTLAGADVRTRMVEIVGKDLPVALLEDATAIGLATFFLFQL
jgi:uncharacterized membrane protein